MNEFDKSQLATQILSVLPNPILVKNASLEYVWVNKAFENLFSVSLEDMVGRLDKDVFPDRQVSQCNGGDLRVLESGVIDESVETVFRASGEARETITRKIRLDLESGETYLLGLMHDISELVTANTKLQETQKELEEKAVELVRLANTDPLTGCGNRNLLESIEIEILKSTRVSAAFLLIDLDNFKRINDEFGHDCGDAVLQYFARVVNKRCPPRVKFLRLGGEEFALVLTGVSLEAAQKFADNLRALIAKSSFRFQGNKIKFTISIGLSYTSTREKSSIRSVLSSADKALYEAKNAGRNAVVLAAA